MGGIVRGGIEAPEAGAGMFPTEPTWPDFKLQKPHEAVKEPRPRLPATQGGSSEIFGIFEA